MNYVKNQAQSVACNVLIKILTVTWKIKYGRRTKIQKHGSAASQT